MQWKYLPILKWKQGERIALRKLSSSQWASLTPLIELQTVGAAPDAVSLRSQLPSYVQKVAKEISTTFPVDKPILIDTRYVAPSYSRQARLLQAIGSALQRQLGNPIVPVLSEGMIDREPDVLGDMIGFASHVLRIRTTHGGPEQLKAVVDAAVAGGIRRRTLHLVVDQYALTGVDAPVLAQLVRPHLNAALSRPCASVTIAGGSFPLNLIGIKAGVSDLPRVEWQIWQLLQRSEQYTSLRYGDYAVTNPAPLPEIDPKQVNPSVAIRYTTATHWRLFKGGGFKKGKPNQYNNLCKLLLSDAVYSGADFSYGDDCYDKAAKAKLGSGNPSSWRRDATNHHLVFANTQV